jgi:hypothetical protein
MGDVVGQGAQMAPGEPTAKRDLFSEVVLMGQLRDAFRY